MNDSLSKIDPQKERDILRTIVLHRVASVEKENEELKKELDVIKRYMSYFFETSFCTECFKDVKRLNLIYCKGCKNFDIYELCESEECVSTLKKFLVDYDSPCCDNVDIDSTVVKF